jgi:aminoglycoside phosphotransferase (APT) family kinase protein
MDALSVADRSRITRVMAAFAPHAVLIHGWPLGGGASADLMAAEIEHPEGHRESVVIRRYRQAALTMYPGMAQAEYRLLDILAKRRLPVPHPLFCDADGQFGGPCIVESLLDGQPIYELPLPTGYFEQCAAFLATLYNSDLPEQGALFLPRFRDRVDAMLARLPAELDIDLSEADIRAALARCWPPKRHHADVVLHGDVWPGNLLWHDGRLTGVVDWEDACLGAPLADVTNARLEFLWHFGWDALVSFTDAVRRQMPHLNYDVLPVYDLAAALRPAGKLRNWGLSSERYADWCAAHRQFVQQALDAL